MKRAIKEENQMSQAPSNTTPEERFARALAHNDAGLRRAQPYGNAFAPRSNSEPEPDASAMEQVRRAAEEVYAKRHEVFDDPNVTHRAILKLGHYLKIAAGQIPPDRSVSQGEQMIATRAIAEQEVLEEGYREWYAEYNRNTALDFEMGLEIWIAGRKALLDEQKPASPVSFLEKATQ